MTMAGLLTALATVTMVAVEATPSSSPYQFRFMRSENPNQDSLNAMNSLTVSCIDVNSPLDPVPNAIFFRGNDVFFDLSNPGMFSQDGDDDDGGGGDGRRRRVVVLRGNRITFVITPQAEGEFSCGIRRDNENFVRSPGVMIIALPSPQQVLTPIVVEARIGQDAVLNCPQRPGVLTRQYYGVWSNSSSDLIFANIPRPSRPSPQASASPRHRNVLNSNFSLIIEDVRLSDSGSWYQCELKVEDIGDAITEYSYGPSVVMELVVFEPAEIVLPPQSTVVSKEGGSVSFSCAALGPITPEIQWVHSDKNITSTIIALTVSKYSVTSTLFSSNGRQGRRGSLVVSDLKVRDTGWIKCVATVPPGQDIGDTHLLTDVASTPFSVLGPYEDLRVFITTKQDVIFSLTFPVASLHPIKLCLLYHEVGGDKESRNITSNIEYVNSSEISYVASGSFVPYERFQVEIALMHEMVVGPKATDNLIHDQTIPSEISAILRQTILPTLLPLLLVGGVILTVLIFVCFHYYRQKNTNQRLREEREEAARRREDEEERHRRDMEALKTEKEKAQQEAIQAAHMQLLNEKARNIADAIDVIRDQLKKEKCSDLKKVLIDALLNALEHNSHINLNQEGGRGGRGRGGGGGGGGGRGRGGGVGDVVGFKHPDLRYQEDYTVTRYQDNGIGTRPNRHVNYQEEENKPDLPHVYDFIEEVDGGVSMSDSDSGSFSLKDSELTDEMAGLFANVTKAMLDYGYSNPLFKRHVQPVVKSCDGDCDES